MASSVLAWLITYFRIYGIPVLGVTVLLQSNGIPTGANFLVIAAGAFAYAGEFNMLSLYLWVWLFNIIGDCVGYYLWNWFGSFLMEKLSFADKFLAPSLTKSAQYLEKYGQASLLITRFPVSGLGPPMNILAGLTRYNIKRFLIAIVPGEFLWTGFNLGMGYWFGDSWETVGLIMNQYLSWILSITALAFVVYALLRQLRIHKLRNDSEAK
jgi:membrane-associated protein